MNRVFTFGIVLVVQILNMNANIASEGCSIAYQSSVISAAQKAEENWPININKYVSEYRNLIKDADTKMGDNPDSAQLIFLEKLVKPFLDKSELEVSSESSGLISAQNYAAMIFISKVQSPNISNDEIFRYCESALGFVNQFTSRVIECVARKRKGTPLPPVSDPIFSGMKPEYKEDPVLREKYYYSIVNVEVNVLFNNKIIELKNAAQENEALFSCVLKNIGGRNPTLAPRLNSFLSKVSDVIKEDSDKK